MFNSRAAPLLDFVCLFFFSYGGINDRGTGEGNVTEIKVKKSL